MSLLTIQKGIGLGAILSRAVNVTQSMIYASAEALSTALIPSEVNDNWLYPDIARIREVSVIVTCGVIRAAQEAGVDRELSLRNLGESELQDYVRSRMYDPFSEGDRIVEEIKQLASHMSRL